RAADDLRHRPAGPHRRQGGRRAPCRGQREGVRARGGIRARGMRLLVVASVAALALIAVGPAGATSRPSAAELESELVCVTSKPTPDESNSPIAQRMKAYIRRRIAQGATAKQIKDELVAEFGEEVLATPPTHGFDLLAWVLPIGGICGGAILLGGLAWAWSRR